MKTVLLPTRAEWCAEIIGGRKTVEVRKTKPKDDAPFKVLLYCTKGGRLLTKSHYNGKIYVATSPKYQKALETVGNTTLNGKVIAEFICDKTLPISVEYSDPDHRLANKEFPFTFLTDKQIMEYLGNGKRGWGWHISELKIYDEPKELSEFYTLCEDFRCEGCEHLKYMPVNSSEYDYECEYDGYRKPILRAPQSWCYVEET